MWRKPQPSLKMASPLLSPSVWVDLLNLHKMEQAKMQAIWQCSTGILRNIRQPCKNMIGSQYPHAGPHCIAGRRWLQGSLGATEDVIAWRMRDSSNPPVTCLNPQEGDHACPAWCWFEPMDQLDNIKMDPSHFPRRCHWRLGFGDRHPDVLQMVVNRLVGQCQSECTHTLCHGVLAPTIVSLNTSFFIFHLPQQLWKRRRLCKADFINSHPFLEMTYYGRINTIEHRAMHASYGTQCNLYGYCLLSDLESYLVILGQLESCYI